MARPIPFRSLFMASVLACLAPACGAAEPVTSNVAAAQRPSQHEQDLTAFLLESHTVSLLRKGVQAAFAKRDKEAQAKPSLRVELVEHYMRVKSEQAMAADLARQCAGKLTPADVSAALATARIPLVSSALREANENGKSPIRLSAAQQQDVERIWAGPGGQALRGVAQCAIDRETMNQLMAAHERALTQDLSAMATRLYQLDHEGGRGVADIPHERTGLPIYDRVLEAMETALRRCFTARDRVNAIVNRQTREAVLASANLVSAEGIARMRAALDEREQAMQAFYREMEDVTHWRADQLREVQPFIPGGSATNLDATVGQQLAALAQASESSQRVLEMDRRMASFAQARLGSVRLSDGKLAFGTQADADAWKEMNSERAALEHDAVGWLDRMVGATAVPARAK
ncbi:MAG: hypothetical protein ACLGI6_19085 [Gammaproteobacteria bacterium]